MYKEVMRIRCDSP